jgi:hypothetical protein
MMSGTVWPRYVLQTVLLMSSQYFTTTSSMCIHNKWMSYSVRHCAVHILDRPRKLSPKQQCGYSMKNHYQRTLSWAGWIQFTLSLRSILILSSHLCVGLSSCLPFRFFNHNFYAPVHITCPTNSTCLYFITLIIYGEVYKLWSLSLSSLL